MKKDGKGYITVNVRTAGGALPVNGATIAIKSFGNVIAVLYSDISGTSDTVELPAPSREESMSPNPDGAVCSFYDIETERDGFYPITNTDVPVYDGITSIQQVLMIPYTPGVSRPDSITRFNSGSLPEL